MSVFEVTEKNSNHVIARAEAPNRRAAIAYGRSQIEARELTSKEIVEVVQSGKGIVEVGAEAEASQE